MMLYSKILLIDFLDSAHFTCSEANARIGRARSKKLGSLTKEQLYDIEDVIIYLLDLGEK